MISRLLFLLILAAAILLGFGVGSGYFTQIKKDTSYLIDASEVTSFKPFTIILIANNNETSIKKTLRSIFEQDYENFRLVFIDDGSRDRTLELAREFVVANRQEHRVVLMKNEIGLGFEASLHRATSQCLDAELILPLKGADWLASPAVLAKLNRAFQIPGVWVVSAGALRYPSYSYCSEGLYCFYEALFKRLDQSKLYPQGLVDLSKNKVLNLTDRLLFSNETR